MDGSTCEARTKPYLHVLRGELSSPRQIIAGEEGTSAQQINQVSGFSALC